MRILTPETFQTTRWKNGGGITHEIARAPGPREYRWRLSIAEVEVDGRFSTFDGMSRILTVIEGNGLKLQSPDAVLNAAPGVPVRFSGETPIEGILVNGPIRDFNVIFDPAVVSADVEAITPGVGLSPVAARGRKYALHCIKGQVALNGAVIGPGAVALFDAAQGGIGVSPDGMGLMVTLQDLDQSVQA